RCSRTRDRARACSAARELEIAAEPDTRIKEYQSRVRERPGPWPRRREHARDEELTTVHGEAHDHLHVREHPLDRIGAYRAEYCRVAERNRQRCRCGAPVDSQEQ